MPTLFYKFGFRFYFVSYDCSEPPHVHVGDDTRKICKFWLANGKAVLASKSGFTKKELSKLERAVNENYLQLLTIFNEFCKGYKK